MGMPPTATSMACCTCCKAIPYRAIDFRLISISRYGFPTILSAKTISVCTPGAFFKCFSSSKPNDSIDSRSGPFTFIPMGARIPLWSMTNRAEIGCNFGADVVPGICATFTSSSQISSED